MLEEKQKVLTELKSVDDYEPTDTERLRQAELQTGPTDSLVGKVICDKFEIIKLVGSGGWADVYEARHLRLGHRVAIKVLYEHLAREGRTCARFEQEARSSMKLSHSNVVAVLDYDVLPEGRPFIVMEFVEGTTVSSLLKRRTKLPYVEALEILEPIALALAQAHEVGVLHRDIKPRNIMICSKPGAAVEMKLLDFGLSKSFDDQILATDTGVTVGTPAYMSPEQCRGGALDGRSDMYSFGCVLYETLTGRLPFVGKNTFDQMNLHISKQATFEHSDRDIPVPVQEMVLRCLEKKHTDRYAGMNELRKVMHDLRTQLPADNGSSWKSTIKNLPGVRSSSRKFLRGLNSLSVQIGSAVGLLAVSALLFHLATKSVVQESLDSPARYAEHLSLGENNLERGQYKLAAEQLRKAWSDLQHAAPDDGRRLKTLESLRKALAGLHATGELSQVDEQIERLVETYPNLVWGNEADNAREIASLSGQTDSRSVNRLIQLRNYQTQLLLTQKRYEDADLQCAKALTLIDQNGMTDSLPRAVALSNKACIATNEGRTNEAESYYKAALALRQQLLPENDPLIAKSYRNIGDFYARNGNPARAIENLRQALTILNGSGHDSELAWTANNLGIVYMKQSDLPAAQMLLEQAFNLRQKIYAPGSVEIARTQNNLGLLNFKQQKYNLAREQLQSALTMLEKDLGRNDIETLQCAFALARTEEQCGDVQAARIIYKRICRNLGLKQPVAKAAADRLAVIGH